jgi:hypothetical protein
VQIWSHGRHTSSHGDGGWAAAGASIWTRERKRAHLVLVHRPPHAPDEVAEPGHPLPIQSFLVHLASVSHRPPANRLRRFQVSLACPPAQPHASATRNAMDASTQLRRACARGGGNETAKPCQVAARSRSRPFAGPTRTSRMLRLPWTPADKALYVRLRPRPWESSAAQGQDVTRRQRTQERAAAHAAPAQHLLRPSLSADYTLSIAVLPPAHRGSRYVPCGASRK